jgi:NACHT domain
MSFRQLRSALLKTPATGQNGFEGVAAALLSALTGSRFYIARSGDQPTDAVSAVGDVAIQGKRYGKTRLNETEFEGEFNKACRLCPKLDSYVLATSRSTAQLKDLAEEFQNQSGVDVLLLEFDSPDSELPSLCVTFWESIRRFPKLAELGSDFGKWAAADAKRPEICATVKRLRSILTESIPLAATVQRKLTQYLSERFGIDDPATCPARSDIRLPTAVVREQPQLELVKWWQGRKNRAAAIVGEEGMGKSWIAARFSSEMSRDSVALVLWLDSADWSGLLDLEAITNAGLMFAGFSERRLRDRLVRKATSRWSDRLLVVLDGVNDRGARETAHRLLAQLYACRTPPCRILFTTRPIASKSDERSLWKKATPVNVGPFTEDELSEALGRLSVPVPRNELSASLAEIAKIPRYFRRASELRQHFQSLTNVSRQMVLWADLLEKVKDGDPQVTERIGWSSAADIRCALRRLAEGAREVKMTPEMATDSYSILQTSFEGRFESIRSDLAEQRVVLEPSGDDPMLSADHLVLGFALYLGSVMGKHSADSVIDLADRLQRELEPILQQHQLTEALFVALQLSAFPDLQGHRLSSRGRSALLFAWASSHNSRVEGQRLRFWATEDLAAYLDFVEEVFVDPVSESWAGLISAPLAEIWRRAGHDLPILDARLRRWLKLIWKSHDLPRESEITLDGHSIPVARSRAQLTLSILALAILSERPIESFIQDLAIAWTTDILSTERHSWGKSPDAEVTEQEDHPCKDLHANLGAVLRWKYAEVLKSKLECIRAQSSPKTLVEKGLVSMIETFDRFGWIRISAPEKHLRERKPLFEGTPEQCRNRFAEGAQLAHGFGI